MPYYFRLFFIILILAFSSAALADTASTAATASSAIPLKVMSGEYRINYEVVGMPLGDSMGLTGFTYMVDVTPNYGFGMGLYGSLTGNYGGFFTIGMENELRYKITDRLSYEMGLFTGGGGGGAVAGQGGGLMLRPHTGLIYDMGSYHVGTEYSWVKFPNGKIDSSQVALVLTVPLENIYADTKYTGQKIDATTLQEVGAPELKVGITRQYITMITESYIPYPNIYKTRGVNILQGVYHVIGGEFGNYTGDNDFIFIELAAAAGGGSNGAASDGYMEILMGKGYLYPLFGSKDLYLLAKGSIGEGGGGFVPTGGGLIYKLYGGLEYRPSSDLTMRVYGGYIGAPTGVMAGNVVGVNMGYMMDTATFDTYAKRLDPADKEYLLKGWRFRSGTQGYFNGNLQGKVIAHQNPIELFSYKVDDMLTDNWYLTGQTMFAYAGGSSVGVGGFAVGLVGAGYQSPLFADKFRVFGEVLVGAAGGGGLAVGGGAAVEAILGTSYRINENMDIQFDSGILKATGTAFRANILEIGITYQFNTINK